VETHIGWLRERIQGLEPAIAGPVKHCEHWKEQQQRLNTVPGVGRVVANTLLALSPELGTLSHSQLAARVEVAPKIIAAPLLPCLRERFAHLRREGLGTAGPGILGHKRTIRGQGSNGGRELKISRLNPLL
jgi:hypothetical protein